jgi:hypothetical protein
VLSFFTRTRALLAPAEPVFHVLDNDPLATLAVTR